MTTRPAHATNRSDPKSRGRQLQPPRLGVEAWWIVGAVLFAMLTVWASAHSLFPGEQELARWLQRHPYPTVLGYEEFADIVGARITLYVLTAFGLALFLVLRRWQLLALVAVAPLLTLAGHLLKVVIQRPRPDISQVIDIREPTTGFSFPSGHSLQAAIIGVVAIILVQQLFTGRLRRVLQAGAVWLTVTVGWERVFDGVHWPTDVAGGFLLGTLLVTASWRGITLVAARSATRRLPGTQGKVEIAEEDERWQVGAERSGDSPTGTAPANAP